MKLQTECSHLCLKYSPRFLVNAALGSTPLSSPLDSPDVLNTLVPLSDIGLTTASMGSMKLPSLDSIHLKQQQKQQVRLFRSKRLDSGDSYENLQRLASAVRHHCASTTTSSATQTQSHPQPPLCTTSLPSRTTSPARNNHHHSGHQVGGHVGSGSVPNGVGGGGGGGDGGGRGLGGSFLSSSASLIQTQSQVHTQTQTSVLSLSSCKCLTAIPEVTSEPPPPAHPSQKLLEFSLSSVGRSFIDESIGGGVVGAGGQVSLTTPETPTPNISPTTSQPCNSDAFSNDFVVAKAPNIPLAEFGGSWDLLELDLQLHEVNLDPCYDTDVEECIFLGDEEVVEGQGHNEDSDEEEEEEEEEEDEDSVVVDDPFGMLPTRPTPPDSLDL
ncbi:hypothetical protein M5D96_013838 [Drosophila gunungcola]|uniref:Uncharacterized protein n=1 Tax=Drosophila gunungcola TaxID=103775 RepID=A0A9P9YB35_9MUSC|nr:hypothetical protein M5D96_013838 [Drosophila gunungcola]